MGARWPDVIPRNLTEAVEAYQRERTREELEACRDFLEMIPDDLTGYERLVYDHEHFDLDFRFGGA